MLAMLLEKVFKSKSDREFRRMHPLVAGVNQCAESYRSLSDDELRGKTVAEKDFFCLLVEYVKRGHLIRNFCFENGLVEMIFR